ncbi:hypothetical protein AB0K12_27485 [Nonomuraea sp. NPDC049419]|uniref:hypothetical protein n=1 Tax=Nonomuraea sp. NPDC049419 TaxID=3155772 RepID=UPI0034311E64
MKSVPGLGERLRLPGRSPPSRNARPPTEITSSPGQKLGVSGRTAAVMTAMERGLL